MKWSKVIQLFINKQEKQDEHTAEDVIRLAVQEIEKAIQKNQNILNQTLTNQAEITQKISAFQKQIQETDKEAISAFQRKQEDKAREFIAQKVNVEAQLKPYLGLLQNINQTVKQLESQISKLKIQIEEAKSKGIILKAKLESAKTQQELAKQLGELDMQNLDLFEQEVNKIELETKLTNDLLALEDEFQSVEVQNNFKKYENELNEAQIQQQKQIEENQFKKVSQLFTQDAVKEKALADEKKKIMEDRKNQLLIELMNSQNQTQVSESKENLMEEFFKPKNENPEIFHQDIDEFFKPKNEDKEKNIDDFFK
jgi:phage shock protein A